MLLRHRLSILFVAVLLAGPALAQTRYITDRYEITLRTGQGTSYQIIRMLPSGTRVEVLNDDPESGWSQVRLPNGTEGYVLTRMLMTEPAARDQLAATRRQMQDLRSMANQASAELEQRTAERDDLAEQLAAVGAERDRLATELDEVRRVSANALALNNQNRQLQERLDAARESATALEIENEALVRNENQRWFLIGAGVLGGGILFGLIAPRLRRRKRSQWSF